MAPLVEAAGSAAAFAMVFGNVLLTIKRVMGLLSVLNDYNA